MKTEETWKYIHAERSQMVETLTSLSAEQWATPSLCAGWSVQEATGHIVAAAEQTPLNFYKELISAGFRFDVFADRGAKRLGAISPNRPDRATPVPDHHHHQPPTHPPRVMAMLGEIIVHGEDIRRPLGLQHRVPEAALAALADNYKKSNLLTGAKRRIAGLKLQATDWDWAWSDGPQVSGPLLSLILVNDRPLRG